MKRFFDMLVDSPVVIGIISGVVVFVSDYLFLSHGAIGMAFLPGLLFGLLTMSFLVRRFDRKGKWRKFFWLLVSTASYLCAFFVAVFLIASADRGEDYMLYVAILSASIIGTAVLYIGFRFIFRPISWGAISLLFVLPMICSLSYPVFHHSSIEGSLPIANLILYISWQTVTLLILSYKAKEQLKSATN